MEKSDKIFVAGADTMIGGALVRQLEAQHFPNVIADTADLTSQAEVSAFFATHRPDYVFVAAGESGGIGANQRYPADLMIHNLLVTTHIIQSAQLHHTKKLMYLASSCVYPKFSAQPMQTDALMTDTLEPTNEAYATAKIAGMKLTQAYRQQYDLPYITVIPSNNYGVGDDFDPDNSHVVGALIHKMHTAKVSGEPNVTVWGTGQARREFIYVDDLADACIFVMQHYDQPEPINVGSGMDVSIKELALMIQKVVGFEGELVFDTDKPDGMPLKMLDTTILQNMGWRSKTPFESALQMTYDWYLQTQEGQSS